MDKKEYLLKFRGGTLAAFIPLLVFCVGTVFICVTWFSLDFNGIAMMAILGLIVGSLFCRNFNEYWEAAGRGMADHVCIYTLLILFVVGMFGALIKASNLSNGFVWLAYNINLKGGGFAAFVFIATCLVSTATGSSFSALYSCFPIFYPAAILLGCKPSVMAGIIISGAIFGDNLAPISDTTILSASCQTYNYDREKAADIGGCVATRFKYSIIAGIISVVIYAIIAGGYSVGEGAEELLLASMDPKPLVMLIPVITMLIIAIRTRNIFRAIITGLIFGTIIGLGFGLITPESILSCTDGAMEGYLYTGFTGMIGVALIILCLNGVMGVMREAGALDALVSAIMNSKLAETSRGAELLLALTMTVITIIMGGAQDPAIITMSPVFDEVGRRKNLHPYRRAELLDGFSNSLAVSLPFISCYVFLTTALTQGYDFVDALSTYQVSSGMVYTFLLFFVLLISILTGWGRIYEGPEGKIMKEDGSFVDHPYSITMKSHK